MTNYVEKKQKMVTYIIFTPMFRANLQFHINSFKLAGFHSYVYSL